ncbi:MAG: flavodoxin family protein [candidate division Zixibacteria bacterium]
MTKILGISGSPVIGSSTELLVREVLKGGKAAGAKTKYIYLNELDIMPCQACGESPDDGYCFFNDGMDEVYKAFDWCDAIVIGSPIYFDSVSAQTKLFIDRSNCFRHYRPESPELIIPRIEKRRKGIIILVGGKREKFEPARKVVGGFFVWANVERFGLISYSHSGFEKGSVKKDKKVMKEAFETGQKICRDD